MCESIAERQTFIFHRIPTKIRTDSSPTRCTSLMVLIATGIAIIIILLGICISTFKSGPCTI